MQSFFHDVFIDNHTHLQGNIEKCDGILRVFSLDPLDANSIPAIVAAGHHFTMGLHPQNIHTMDNAEFKEIAHSHENTLLAIGESGLDKFISIPMEDQKRTFKQQAYLAEEMQKPLIIHCVRSYDEVIQLHKEIQPKKSWIIHGFNRNEYIANSLIEQGIVLSIGKDLLTEHHPLAHVICACKEIPFLLETDGKDIDIEHVYQRCALLLKMDMLELKVLIETHFKQIYGTN